MEARGNGNNYNQPLPKPYVLDVHSIKVYGPPRSKFVIYRTCICEKGGINMQSIFFAKSWQVAKVFMDNFADRR